jgi:hypothetical protein
MEENTYQKLITVQLANKYSALQKEGSFPRLHKTASQFYPLTVDSMCNFQ